MSHPGPESNDLTDVQWQLLMSRIKSGYCMPILGAGVSYPTLPLAAELAQTLADEYHYPSVSDIVNTVDNGTVHEKITGVDLAQIAQFMAVKYDAVYPKERLSELFW